MTTLLYWVKSASELCYFMLNIGYGRNTNTMRYFLGLDFSASHKLAIESWREKALPKLDKPVPAANFHITLCFLGQISEHQLESICLQMDELDQNQITLQLGQLGYFSKPKVLFVAPHSIPESLSSLAKVTAKIAKNSHIELRHDEYIPHVTIARGLKIDPPSALFDLDLKVKFENVHLFESVSGKHTAHYPIRKSWRLFPKLY